VEEFKVGSVTEEESAARCCEVELRDGFSKFKRDSSPPSRVDFAPELVGSDCGWACPWLAAAMVLFKPEWDLLMVLLVPELVGTTEEGTSRGPVGAVDPELVGCGLIVTEVLSRPGARARTGALLG
jgi:hypothetical protein